MCDHERPDDGNNWHRARAQMPSVVVLPFTCPPEEALLLDFGSVLSLAVAMALMRISGLRVISTLGRAGDVESGNAANQVDARYRVSGYVEQCEQTLTLDIQLQDVDETAPLRIGPLRVPVGRLHDMKRDIVSHIVAGILPEVRAAEIERALSHAPSVDAAYHRLLLAIISMHKQTREAHRQAEFLLKEALAIDPNYADAYAWYARLLSIRVGQGWATDRQETCRDALAKAVAALAFDPDNTLALATAGHLNSYLLRDYDIGLELLRRAVNVGPNEPMAWLYYGLTLAYVGQAERGREHAETALELSPHDPFAYNYNAFIGVCCYLANDFEAAVKHCRRSLHDNCYYSAMYKVLAASFVALGQIDLAREAGAKILQLEPNYPAIAEATLPYKHPVIRELTLSRLRIAGALTSPAMAP